MTGRIGRSAAAVMVLLTAFALPSLAAHADPACIASGDETTINAALTGPGAQAVLCADAVFELHASVVFNAPGQGLYTQGRPTGSGRAVLQVDDAALSVAVRFTDQAGAMIGYVEVDGNRRTLGFEPTSGNGGTGDALLAGGGNSTGQVVEHVLARDARSWSALHITEGPMPDGCSGASVHDNEILGPTAARDEWSDGISFACSSSTVEDNQVTDASDGGIVVFGAPGTLVAHNTVESVHQEELGGINLVDYAPYSGDYTGTVVRDNTVESAGAPMHIGIAQGWGSWFCADDPATYAANELHGASVLDNHLGGPQLIYAMVASGVTDWTVTGNTAEPNQIAQPAVAGCNGKKGANPTPFLYDAATTHGTIQPDFTNGHTYGALFAVTSWGLPVATKPTTSATTSTTTTGPTTSTTIAPSASSTTAPPATPVVAPATFTG